MNLTIKFSIFLFGASFGQNIGEKTSLKIQESFQNGCASNLTLTTPFNSTETLQKTFESDVYCKYKSHHGNLIILLDDKSLDGFLFKFTIGGTISRLTWLPRHEEKYVNPIGESVVFPVTKTLRTGKGGLHLKTVFIIFDDLVEYHMKKRGIASLAEGRKFMAKIFNTVVKDELKEQFLGLNLKFHILDIKFLSTKNAHSILTKGSHDASLNEFNVFQRIHLYDSFAQEYDAIVGFVHTKYFAQGVVGYAYTGTVGNIIGRKSMSGIVDSSRPFSSIAVTATHEIGHILGMTHEDSWEVAGTCNDPAGCIMSAIHAQGKSDYEWSEYAKNYASDNFHNVDSLYEKPQKVFGGPVCGNGIVEDGEDCDCGKPICPCCDSCRKPPSAQCTDGECCDLGTCELKKSSTICRKSESACEPDVYCTGEDSFCPASVFYRDGFECGKNKICYEGVCRKERVMEDYGELIPDGYEDDMCYNSCGERLLCVFEGYLPVCIAALPEDVCSSRGDPLNGDKCDCECGFAGENCEEKEFCMSKFIFWFCFAAGMLLLLIAVGIFIYFKFMKQDSKESSTNKPQTSRTENSIPYNAGRPQRAAPAPPILSTPKQSPERYTAAPAFPPPPVYTDTVSAKMTFTSTQKPAPKTAKKIKKSKNNLNSYEFS